MVTAASDRIFVRVNIVCPRCRRPAASFSLGDDDGVLRPDWKTELVPAGPKGAREEYRWRFGCGQPRCRIERVVHGSTLSDRTARALRAGRYVDSIRIRGGDRKSVKSSLRRGDLASWEEARQTFGTRRIVTLVLGEDL